VQADQAVDTTCIIADDYISFREFYAQKLPVAAVLWHLVSKSCHDCCPCQLLTDAPVVQGIPTHFIQYCIDDDVLQRLL
jgi:hypothetical protein